VPVSLRVGLVVRQARALGLRVPAWVKTPLTPGSPSAERQLCRTEVLQDLEALGFGIAGYGCATCIGNFGPLLSAVAEARRDARAEAGRGAVGQPQPPRPGASAD
jgi:aconitate hydratase